MGQEGIHNFFSKGPNFETKVSGEGCSFISPFH